MGPLAGDRAGGPTKERGRHHKRAVDSRRGSLSHTQWEAVMREGELPYTVERLGVGKGKVRALWWCITWV